jgi:hypothetical protein
LCPEETAAEAAAGRLEQPLEPEQELNLEKL